MPLKVGDINRGGVMFCTNCGTKFEASAMHCTQCGANVGGETSANQGSYPQAVKYGVDEASLPKGCLVLVLSIFTMPIKTAHVAASELRRVGRAGSLDADNDFPHLSWLKAVQPVVATILSILIVLYGVIHLFTADEYTPFSQRIGTAVGSIFVAIAADWAIMMLGELISISIVAAQFFSKQIRKNLD